MKLLIQICILPFFIFFTMCTSSRNAFQEKVQGPMVELYKGACFGTCPVFKLSVYEDGTILYEGHRFTERTGIHARKLNKKERETLHQILEGMDWSSYKNYYESQIPDLQMTVIEHGTQQYKFKEEAPHKLQVLGRFLDKIANEGSWERLASVNVDDVGMSHNLIVQVEESADIEQITDQLAWGQVEVRRKISDHMNSWLLRYDHQKISPGQLFIALSSHPEVVNIEFNAQLQLRDE
ncbi:MAG: DUF6438 domain-containing protein [Saprospiraceae bacterium]|nr:DUF6438 domain-containing protein [Saprospiraceae bacterium]